MDQAGSQICGRLQCHEEEANWPGADMIGHDVDRVKVAGGNVDASVVETTAIHLPLDGLAQ